MEQNNDGVNPLKILQTIYQLAIIPMVAFIAFQTYQINAKQAATHERLKHLEFNQASMADQMSILKANQLLLCTYEEPAWPNHSRCIR